MATFYCISPQDGAIIIISLFSLISDSESKIKKYALLGNRADCDIQAVSSIYIWNEICWSPSEAKYGGQWRP